MLREAWFSCQTTLFVGIVDWALIDPVGNHFDLFFCWLTSAWGHYWLFLFSFHPNDQPAFFAFFSLNRGARYSAFFDALDGCEVKFSAGILGVMASVAVLFEDWLDLLFIANLFLWGLGEAGGDDCAGQSCQGRDGDKKTGLHHGF